MGYTRTMTGLAAAGLLSIAAATAGCGSGSGWFDTTSGDSQLPQYPQLPQQTVTETESQTPESSATEESSPESSYEDADKAPPKTPSDCFATYQTKQSHVQLCEVYGEVYYYGSSAVGSITLPAHMTAAGTYRTEVNDGYVYTVNSDELVITRDGELFSEQPVTSSSE